MADYIRSKRQNDQDVRENNITQLQPFTNSITAEFKKKLESYDFSSGILSNFVIRWTFKTKLSDSSVQPNSTNLLEESVKNTLIQNHSDLNIDYVKITNACVDNFSDMPCGSCCLWLCICCVFPQLTKYNVYVSFKEKKSDRV